MAAYKTPDFKERAALSRMAKDKALAQLRAKKSGKRQPVAAADEPQEK